MSTSTVVARPSSVASQPNLPPYKPFPAPSAASFDGDGRDADAETAVLIASFLQEDADFLASTYEAERLQMLEAVEASAALAGVSAQTIPEQLDSSASPASDANATEAQVQGDALLAFSTAAQQARLIADTQTAHELSRKVDYVSTQDAMLAAQVAANERKMTVDHAFTEHLQAEVNRGRSIVAMKDAEQVLGRSAVDDLMFSRDPNSKGKAKAGPEVEKQGKGKGKEAVDIVEKTQPPDTSEVVDSSPGIYDVCGICMEVTWPVPHPFKAAIAPTSSARVVYGFKVAGCSHCYCIGCLQSYFSSKLTGQGDAPVFPIRCPGCHDSHNAFDDASAEAILGSANMISWWQQRILDSMPRFFCPRKQCSASILVPEDPTQAQSTCPSCQEQVCAQCVSVWHEGLSCVEFQGLPDDERSVEDGQMMKLAQKQLWRRCPACRAYVERVQGCNHMICRCRTEFCYACGLAWNKKTKTCSRRPHCDLFFVPPEVGVHAVAASPGDPQRTHANLRPLLPSAFPPINGLVPLGPIQQHFTSNGQLDLTHPFTFRCVSARACPLCKETFGGERELYEHLDSPVHVGAIFFCCGRIFMEEAARVVHQTNSGCTRAGKK